MGFNSGFKGLIHLIHSEIKSRLRKARTCSVNYPDTDFLGVLPINYIVRLQQVSGLL